MATLAREFVQCLRGIKVCFVALSAIVLIGNFSNERLVGAQNADQTATVPKVPAGNLYTCEWSYLQLDSSMVAFNINHLSLIDRNNETDLAEISETFTEGYGSIEAKNFALSEISVNASSAELRASSRLNPNLPFVFYINGFNTFNEDGEVNGTWMFDVAKMFARRGLQNRRNKVEPDMSANVIFLTWGIPHIFAESVLAIVPAYFKTIANYDLILDFVSETIMRLIDFVEESRVWESDEQRSEYYTKFQFFGHSLGSHIITDAISRVRKLYGPRTRFGKLMGLDPAMPCFLSLGHENSKQKLANSTVKLVILHSNAGFAGLTSERANVEIVLNGGTFQPGCSWWDLACHHARSTNIFGYMDDRCQMVAYKCSSYHHFKSGACETCEFDPRSGQRESDAYGQNCVLVNMPEQHKDTKEVLKFVRQVGEDQVRHLARENEDSNLMLAQLRKRIRDESASKPTGAAQPVLLSPRVAGVNSLGLSDAGWPTSRQTKTGEFDRNESHKRVYYHYVNTSPNYASGRKTHCLQHYQIRAIVLHPDIRALRDCPLSSFLSEDAIQLRLFHDDSKVGQQAGGINWRVKPNSEQIETDQPGQGAEQGSGGLKSSPEMRLGGIIKDNLYTTLLNFEGSPEVFVGAEISNIQADQFAKCLESHNITASPSMVVDVAFMSHTTRKFRRAFSSILCAKLVDNEQQKEIKNMLLLRLCKQSELTTVSEQIDRLLEHIEQQRLTDSWKVSFLNSLFSLFAEWEPF